MSNEAERLKELAQATARVIARPPVLTTLADELEAEQAAAERRNSGPRTS